MKLNSNYSTHKGVECLSSCLYNLLINDGVRIGASDIFFAGKGMNLIYIGKYNERMIYSRQYNSNFVFMDKFMNHTKRKYDNTCNEEVLLKLIDDNSYLIIRVSSAHLPYNRVFNSSKVISHYINVLDYKNNKILISDGCPPVNGESVFLGWVDVKDIVCSWKAMNGEYLLPEYDKNALSNVNVYANKLFKKQLKKYITKKRFIQKRELEGVGCILAFLDDIEPLFDYNVDELPKIIMECNRQLRINGFLQEKEFISIKLKELFEDSPMVISYEDIKNDWDRLLLKLAMAGVKRDCTEFKKIVKNANILVEKERNILKNILNKL